MDLDPSSFKNSEQRTSRGDHRYIAKGLGHDKAYKCTFCKRGFSNAQALGGHMNVHRKDRARLKEFSCENSLSLEIISRSTTTDRGDSSLPTELSSLTSQKPSSPSGKDAKENSCLPYENGDPRVVEEDPIHDLPLFSEEPSVSEVGEKHGAENFGKGRVDQEELGSSRAVSRVEVDLELRLGPEPA